jgi:hypothetical protein
LGGTPPVFVHIGIIAQPDGFENEIFDKISVWPPLFKKDGRGDDFVVE